MRYSAPLMSELGLVSRVSPVQIRSVSACKIDIAARPRAVLIKTIAAVHIKCLLRVKSRIPPERSHVSFCQLLRTYQRTRVQQLCAKRRPEQVQQRA